jgi:hypothetical protein
MSQAQLRISIIGQGATDGSEYEGIASGSGKWKGRKWMYENAAHILQ